MLILNTTTMVVGQSIIDSWVGVWEGKWTSHDFIEPTVTLDVSLIISKENQHQWSWQIFHHEDLKMGYPKFAKRCILQYTDSSSTPYEMREENGNISYFKLLANELFSAKLQENEDGTWVHQTHYELINNDQINMTMTAYPLPQEKHVFGKMHPTLIQKATLQRKK
jgi:hypothetical protein